MIVLFFGGGGGGRGAVGNGGDRYCYSGWEDLFCLWNHDYFGAEGGEWQMRLGNSIWGATTRVIACFYWKVRVLEDQRLGSDWMSTCTTIGKNKTPRQRLCNA